MTEISLIQARADTELKNEASELFESLGLDMTTVFVPSLELQNEFAIFVYQVDKSKLV